MQTSVRMWYETVRNWITEIPGTTTNPQYVDVGVQTKMLPHPQVCGLQLNNGF
jgi:hypothetical protein